MERRGWGGAAEGAHRRKRERRPLPGMMLHQDSSRHAWLEGQAPDVADRDRGRRRWESCQMKVARGGPRPGVDKAPDSRPVISSQRRLIPPIPSERPRQCRRPFFAINPGLFKTFVSTAIGCGGRLCSGPRKHLRSTGIDLPFRTGVCYLHLSMGHSVGVLSLRWVLAQAWLSSDESRCYGLRPMGCRG